MRNIIDKLAQFVARNGPDFEQMTKNKQKGNSKFQFLFGGEYFNYYQYKVTTEQASNILRIFGIITILKLYFLVLEQQGMNISSLNGNWSQSLALTSQESNEIEQLIQQQELLREQITQSEQNLSAQHTVSKTMVNHNKILIIVTIGAASTTTSSGRKYCYEM